MTASKILLLIIDGVGDRPCACLGGKTPLQAAEIPNLDRIAKEGICGIMDPVAPGIRAGSDTAHLSLLGYEPQKYYTGRGPLEAAGVGINMKPGMIGFRENLPDDSTTLSYQTLFATVSVPFTLRAFSAIRSFRTL